MRESERRERVRTRERHRVIGRDHRRKHAERARDAEASKAALLAAAEDIFARDGFDGARVDEIARAAGYNKSLIFQYFGDKEGLYNQIVWRMREQSTTQIGAIVERFTGPDAPPVSYEATRDFIEACVRWTFDFYVTHPNFLRIHAWEAAECWRTFTTAGSPEGEAAQTKGKAWARAVLDYLTRAQEAGYLRRDLDPRLLITSVISQAEHYLLVAPRFERILPTTDLSSSEAIRRAREQSVALFLYGALVPNPETQQEAKDIPHATGL
ncbi:MAG TPA: TetR family transcriptional regulator [Ktedonobacterales bacterium]|jgi:AcrR family transcriptional regulator